MRHTNMEIWTEEYKGHEHGDVYREGGREVSKNLLISKEDVAPGKVVSLSSKLTTRVLPHNAIIAGVNDENQALLVPFSYMSEPGMVSECRSSIDEQYLRVLQGFNAKWVPVDVITGYMYDTGTYSLSAARIAHGLVQSLWTGSEFHGSTGGPITNLEDPRIRYQEKEIESLQGLERLLDIHVDTALV